MDQLPFRLIIYIDTLAQRPHHRFDFLQTKNKYISNNNV